MKNDILALVAAVAAGIAGVFVFLWIGSQGFYALILPGAMIGLAASSLKPKLQSTCIVCGLMALAAGLLSEWKLRPFIKDDSLAYFLAHLRDLKPITVILISVGTVMGFYFPFRHRTWLNSGNTNRR